MTIPINEELNQTVGERTPQAVDTVTDVAGTHVTSNEETVDQFRNNVNYIGPEGREGKIKDGAGKGGGFERQSGNDKPNEASENPEWDDAVFQADGDSCT
ncbi:hypothetical protein [Marinimicrobium locisalis]|uniref:hypothetical protein n=1 Tax=Marinimicrobium locisalis TaxID=546022 RepID=UPI0032217DE8